MPLVTASWTETFVTCQGSVCAWIHAARCWASPRLLSPCAANHGRLAAAFPEFSFRQNSHAPSFPPKNAPFFARTTLKLLSPRGRHPAELEIFLSGKLGNLFSHRGGGKHVTTYILPATCSYLVKKKPGVSEVFLRNFLYNMFLLSELFEQNLDDEFGRLCSCWGEGYQNYWTILGFQNTKREEVIGHQQKP